MSFGTRSSPEGIIESAINTVTSQMEKLNNFTSQYRGELSQSLKQIAAIKIDPVEPPQPMDPVDVDVPNVDLNNKPRFTPTTLRQPGTPVFHGIDDLLSDLDLNDIVVPSMPDMPAIQLPDAPGFRQIAAPDKPDLSTEIALPDAPQLDMPELEALHKIEIPVFDFPELTDFDGIPPNLNSITVPNVFIDWIEPQYKTELLDQIQSIVKKGLSEGGTGLSALIEDAMFNRARSRESRETDRAVAEATQEWASRNFSMPPGMLAKQVAAIREKGQLKASELNRDILIEAAKWEIENFRFLMEQGMGLEQLLSNLHSNMLGRLFEVARFNAESQMNVFNAQVALFNAQNAAFETLSNVYRIKLDGALAKLNAYKTAVDAQVAIGQINEQYVQVYKARVDAVLSNVEIYKALIQGASIRADVMKSKFDAYRTEVQAYGEEINAEKVRVDAYEAQVRGETSKVNMFEAQARAFASNVQAIQSQAEIKSKSIQLKMEAARTWITKYSTDMEGYKAELQSSLGEIQANTSAFSAQVEAWKASASMEVANVEVKSRFSDMNTRTNIAYAEMQIKQYESKNQKAVQEAQIALDAAKAIGQYSAQLAAGAMSAAHISASISGSGSASNGYSKTESESQNHNYSY